MDINYDNTNCFRPGEVWLDTDGEKIQAHGGGILFYEDIYYWYGENKDTTSYEIEIQWYEIKWKNYRTDLVGISCYSSKNLLDWKNEGVVLKAIENDDKHDLHISKVMERPKVVYNRKTNKFVMWMHIDTTNYMMACCGIAISDSPLGPFEYLGSFRPHGECRDMTVFVDDDQKAYHIYSSEKNMTTHISLLSDDYLMPSGVFVRAFIDKGREAHTVFKYNGKYYMITSGLTGWDPNQAQYAVSDNIMGEWKIIGNPCVGRDSEITFSSQSTFVLPLAGKQNSFIFMADKWIKEDLSNSRYVWLPIEFEKENIKINWLDAWDLSCFDKLN